MLSWIFIFAVRFVMFWASSLAEFLNGEFFPSVPFTAIPGAYKNLPQISKQYHQKSEKPHFSLGPFVKSFGSELIERSWTFLCHEFKSEKLGTGFRFADSACPFYIKPSPTHLEISDSHSPHYDEHNRIGSVDGRSSQGLLVSRDATRRFRVPKSIKVLLACLVLSHRDGISIFFWYQIPGYSLVQ